MGKSRGSSRRGLRDEIRGKKSADAAWPEARGPGESDRSVFGLVPCALRLLPFLLFLFLLCPFALCADYPFDNAANWGGTGLMEIPTARILDDGTIRVGVAQALPFRWFTGGMGILPGMELSGRLTASTNRTTLLQPEYGSAKDKAFDVKYQVFPESRLFPALAVGLQDFFGTKLWEAQYLVLSRQIFPLDFTLGIGRKRLQGPLSPPLFDEVGLFGGVEIALHPRVNAMVEYNPVEYEKDPRLGLERRPPVPEGAEWPINLGLRYKVFPNLAVGLSFQRGDTLGLSLHLQEKLGDPILPHRPDPPPQVPGDRRPFRERDTGEMVARIHDELHEAGFTDVSVYCDGQNLTAEFENTKYLSNQKAVGRVLRTMLYHSPSDTKRLTAVVKRKGISLLSVSVASSHLEKYLLGEIRQEIFDKLVEVKSGGDIPVPLPQDEIRSDESRFSYSWGVKPDLDTYLNDPSGFFKFRPGVKPYAIASLWKGAQAYGRYDIPFYSNIESSNPAPRDSVYLDSWKYMDRNYSFDRLILDQTIPLWDNTFGRISLGYLDKMYMGFGGEVLTLLADGTFALGMESDWVRKREPDTQFSLIDVEFHTALANAYYVYSPLGITLQVQFGRFMAGDVGWKFTVGREYTSGIVVGGWYSLTDTKDLAFPNKDYNEKGVFLSLPVRLFSREDSPRRYNYAISPWSRDVAATPARWQSLFDVLGDITPKRFRSKLPEMTQ